MPEEYSSPEEKLLRLIRGEKKPKEKIIPREAVSQTIDSKAIAVMQDRNIAVRVAQPKVKGDHVKLINISLIAILVIIASVFLLDIISFNLKRPSPVAEITPRIAERSEPQYQPQLSSDISNNSDALVSRDLFKAPAVASTSNIPQPSYEKLRDLSLKGIIAGDKPQAIIEDEKNKKSYFLYKGESVNDIKVEDIRSDRVILRVNGEVFELTL